VASTSARELDGLGVAITGGAGDIGAAMGAELVRRGAGVTLIDRKPQDAARPWIQRVGDPDAIAYIEADVRDRPAIDAALAAIEPLDIVIGNAGIVHDVPFLELTQRQWQDQIDINLTGCFNVGQAAARLMAERGGGGRIVFTGSWVGEVPWPGDSAYSVSKAGLRMLTRSMARELAEYRILVNLIAPGILSVGLAGQVAEADPTFVERARAVVPLGSLQTAEQVARATAFLCSPDSDYMTGAVLLVDGGCSLFRFG
jgi:NAD(P)-dependent dehydrogenase (short-subunit alcohol dehydrogenase family)